MFIEAFRTDIGSTSPTFAVETLDGGISSGPATLEGVCPWTDLFCSSATDPALPCLLQSLDLDYTVGLATGIPVTLVSVGNDFVQGFLDLSNDLLAQEEVPLVLSVSFGFNETDLIFAEDFAMYVYPAMKHHASRQSLMCTTLQPTL